MSYDPTLSYAKAEQLLVSTATDGNLNVAAAFQADGLGAIVAQGNANIPKPPAPTSCRPSRRRRISSCAPRAGSTGCSRSRSAASRSDRLSIELEYPHSRTRHLSTRRHDDHDPHRTTATRVATGDDGQQAIGRAHHRPPHMTTTRIRSLPALVLAGLLLAAATPSAAAASGSYTVTACSPTTSPGAWQQINTFPGGMTSGNQCGGPTIGPLGGGDPGALYGEDLVGSTAHSPSGAQAGWSFTAPAGTTITAVSYYRSLETGNNLRLGRRPVRCERHQLDTCQTNPDPCSKPNNQVAVTLSGLSTSGLFFGIECEPVAPDTDCLAGATEHYAQADMYSAKVTLSETATPSVSNLGGALWGGGVVWGSEPVTFNAVGPERHLPSRARRTGRPDRAAAAVVRLLANAAVPAAVHRVARAQHHPAA